MWLKDTNGAIYRIAEITSVTPREYRDDKRDQTKVTRVHAAITTTGGHTHETTLNFDDVVKAVDPPASAATPAAS